MFFVGQDIPNNRHCLAVTNLYIVTKLPLKLLQYNKTMELHIIPNQLFPQNPPHDINIFDYHVNEHNINNKVSLQQNVFSFLVQGEKKVHFSENTVTINPSQALLMASGNCLMSECLGESRFYQSILLFFSQKNVADFLLKYPLPSTYTKPKKYTKPFFIIEKDDFILHFIESLKYFLNSNTTVSERMLHIKLEEILLYLQEKYGQSFVQFLVELPVNNQEISFRTVVENNLYTNLSLDEMAFLCNMSLSTFKRHFQQIYHESPGKWLQSKRLAKAKEILTKGEATASEIFFDFGYENLSNFSAAFKHQFGISPRQV
jgi:AraC-like DNA-binding protein